MVLCRDGIRDVTLSHFDYNVWDRAVSSNWSVVGLFLVVFVGGLASVGFVQDALFIFSREMAAFGFRSDFRVR